VEVFNSFCQAERAGLLGRGESRQVIRLLEHEVRVGYWSHVEFDWTDAVRTAGELRAEHSLDMVVRSMDLFHVAIAIEVGADALLSFDAEQIALAKAAGLDAFNLIQKSR
jgi:predicted nucleic acid-binding protein